MPIYEYVCDNGHRFEVIHGIHDAGPTACPVCRSTAVRKAFAPPTIHFKGSGWAKKDRSATSRSGAASTDSTSTEKPAASPETAGGEATSSPTATSREPAATSKPSAKGDAD